MLSGRDTGSERREPGAGAAQDGAVQGSDAAPSLDQQSAWRVFDIVLIAVATLAAATVIWLAIDVLLLLFGAVLLANFLRAPTEALTRITGMREGLALSLVALAVLVCLAAFGLVLAPRVIAQMPQLIENLGHSLETLNAQFGLAELAEGMAEEMQGPGSILPSASGLIGGATRLISSTFGLLANALILLVIAVYLAATPGVYLRGVTRLFPRAKRPRVRETLGTIGQTLRWWFIGQLISMSAVGLMSYVGLVLLGVPLALALAVIAFLATFIPFIGPALSAVPVVVVAFSESAQMAVSALVLYVVIQSLEGYILTPMVQRKSVALPPALTISAQILLGVLVGALGVIFATPLAAAGMVAVKMLYVEDVLGDEVETQVPARRT